MAKCRNCDAPHEQRFCPKCGADSKALRFSDDTDPLKEIEILKAQNKKLTDEFEELKKKIKGDDANSDI